MNDQTKDFGMTAQSLARNPLGIIALFIVLVYGFASLVTLFGGAFSPSERQPLIYFLIVFPVLVLLVFAWLVSNHSGKLFSPADFKDESNYLKMQLAAVASLAAATTKQNEPASQSELQRIVETVQATKPSSIAEGSSWKRNILWVDDNPGNNIYERQAFEALGLRFELAQSTGEALDQLKTTKFAAIISDMGRKEGPREGYVLLDRIRSDGNETPLFFYASSNSPEHKRETREHGGQGCTNNAQELFEMVTKSVIHRLAA